MNISSKYVHGYISIALMLVAFAVAAVAIACHSVTLSVVYVLGVVLGFFCVAMTYCTKCSGRDNCAHYFIGKLSKWLSTPREGTYTANDYIALSLPLLFIIGFPQYWLIASPWLLILFWVLMAIGGVQILVFVCPKCDNKECAMCRNKEE